ncbi:hypothetical protein RND71_011302 [Anisodus tanguticus]|uniref:Trichome birefringence-like C-terminal domain-containing protein n=1 Tax=Anisodus tanguticus TaxID=243964 RepID=A0AAE1VPL8_9SOLA|nr:hypothetical protein RND71_011302 [Anisodus tanguticus]
MDFIGPRKEPYGVYAGDRTRDFAVPRSTATPTWLPLRVKKILSSVEPITKSLNRLLSGVIVLLRTVSAGQFEHGAWNEGGNCNRTRTRLFAREEVKIGDQDWKFRSIQIEEIKRARKYGQNIGNMFELVDVTRAMLMRPDGHPGEYREVTKSIMLEINTSR